MSDLLVDKGAPSGVGEPQPLQQVERTYPSIKASIELLKPITWFAPMWAFACGVISSGANITENWIILCLGVLLAGPLVCGMSQAINDWHDRHVDAINEPNRPIPSGRVPGSWGFYIALLWTGLSLAVASTLGFWVLGATVVGLFLAWAYSAPPFRLKKNGWFGNAAVGFSYEGLAWFTGAAVMVAGFPDLRIVSLAVLYSIGAHGIMTLNDFKAIAGDKEMNVRSLPVQLGIHKAARLACVVMALPQVIVIALLVQWGQTMYAYAVTALLFVQFALMARYLLNQRSLEENPWTNAAVYNATGTTAYVLGMMVAAFGIRGLLGG